MTTPPESFADRASAALGGRGWQARLSRALGVDASTVRRWVSGAIPIPAYAWAVVELLEAVPTAFRPARWLGQAASTD